MQPQHVLNAICGAERVFRISWVGQTDSLNTIKHKVWNVIKSVVKRWLFDSVVVCVVCAHDDCQTTYMLIISPFVMIVLAEIRKIQSLYCVWHFRMVFFLENPPHGTTFVSSTSITNITTSMKTTWMWRLFFVYMKAEVNLQLKANFQKICKRKWKWQLLFIHYSFAKPVFYCNLLPCLIIDATFPPQPSVKMLLQYRVFFFVFFLFFFLISSIFRFLSTRIRDRLRAVQYII